MNIEIKRIDPTLPLPVYHTSGAVAFDLYARETTIVPPFSTGRIPTNFIIKVPSGLVLYVKDRSSTAPRKGLLATAGIIDQDFHGPDDEVLFQVYNPGVDDVVVERWERIAQAMFVRIEQVVFIETHEPMKQVNRGGFGTTGERVIELTPRAAFYTEEYKNGTGKVFKNIVL